MILKALYKCSHCHKDFNKDGEEVYTIMNLIMQVSEIDKKLHWRWVKPEEDGISAIGLMFHKKCFQEIAGDLYLSEGVPVNGSQKVDGK